MFTGPPDRLGTTEFSICKNQTAASGDKQTESTFQCWPGLVDSRCQTGSYIGLRIVSFCPSGRAITVRWPGPEPPHRDANESGAEKYGLLGAFRSRRRRQRDEQEGENACKSRTEVTPRLFFLFSVDLRT